MKITTYNYLEIKRINEILNNIKAVNVGVIGDIALDVYWDADMRLSEISRETPHFPLPIVKERMHPGAAGNVLMNIAALKPNRVIAMAVIGDDWRHEVLIKLLKDQNIDTSSIIQSDDWLTCAYCKPLRKGISETVYEDPRIDFANYAALNKEAEEAVIASIDRVAPELDVLCVADQFKFGCITDAIRERLDYWGSQGLSIIIDSRNHIAKYKNVILKPNEVECMTSIREALLPEVAPIESFVDSAYKLAKLNQNKVCMTLGHRGCIVVEDMEEAIIIPTAPAEPPVDICGAGDTFISTLASCIAAGAKIHEAAYIANYASFITVKKIAETGTACIEEIKEVINQSYYDITPYTNC